MGEHVSFEKINIESFKLYICISLYIYISIYVYLNVMIIYVLDILPQRYGLEAMLLL